MSGFGARTYRNENGAERVARHVAKHSRVPRVACADPARRAKLEKEPAKWLRYYLAETYKRDWDRPHLEIIMGALRALKTGGRFVVAAERGIGKSAVLYGLVLYFALAGRSKFPVYLPWAQNVMKRGLNFWRVALSFNERILADYPEYAQPFAHARGYSNRMRALVWADTDKPTGAGLQVSDGLIVLPDNLGVIGGSTVNGNPRGLNLPQPDGSVLRPDLALIDDPQDRKVAKSFTLTTETIFKIDGDIAGLGCAGASFPLLLSGNCIAESDVVSHYLADKQWRSLRVSCVEEWPDRWDEKGSTFKLWEEWWEEYKHDEKAALGFYKKNKAVMIRGMKLSAPHAYQDQKSKTLPDAFCVAMRQYFQMGHAAFFAERQQTPISMEALAPFQITIPLITSRTDSRNIHEKPEYVRHVVASSDINDYGLSSCICGLGNDQTVAVLWYGMLERGPGKGIMDANAPEAIKAKQLFDALCQAGEALSNCASRPTVWAIDGGYMGQVVRRYADTTGRKCGMQIIICRGMDGQRYRPGYKAIGAAREQCHLTDWPQIGRGLAWNAHYWKEIMQRAWLGDVGRPGSISLPRGEHRDIAEQIVRERLLGRSEVAGRQVWVFAHQPGRHDYGDALAQAYAIAAYGGIGTSGQMPQRKRYIEKRKAKVSIVE